MTQENHDQGATVNTGEHVVETEAQKRPKIFSAGLSDKELIEFLRDTINKLEARKHNEGTPERLRAMADDAERKLNELNEFIYSVLYQQS
ncbi:hypothetical protein [Dickeya zeae]|uniref:hypothetical protein n=1 Tax=Dickeya zeae TaxID=204042 RepID=UPI00205FFA26|nr:hypothetical protein [Dickeya zeae]UPT55491.1 hypothetical protein FGI00_07965 [Dickeya zeae]